MTTVQTSTPLEGKPGSSAIEMPEKRRMKRDVNWLEVVFIAAGAPALVMFNLGALAAVVGTISPLIWAISVVLGFLELFTYAEIAGLHPNKTGGTAVHGATAWVRYSKIVAPMSIWSNWLAWSPILAIGAGLAAAYLLSIFVPADSPVNTWQIVLVNLSYIQSDLTLRINAQFILGCVIMVAVWSVQHVGILRTARAAVLLTAGGLIPLLLVSILPIFQGGIDPNNFSPFVPLNGSYNLDGWRLIIGGLFLAAWSTYAAETAVCYMSEFRNPGKDAPKAIMWSGIVCIVLYVLTPFVFQGVLGTKAMMSPDIVSGNGVGVALAEMVHAGGFAAKLVVVILIFTLLLAILTAMAGSSRTLYEGGSGGWMPKYLDKLNSHGIPTRAMWTDLTFNAFLLLMSDDIFVLAVSCVNYVLFHFLNLNAGWIHRKDNPRTLRPYTAPQPLFIIGICLAYFNAFLIGAGSDIWGPGVLLAGLASAFISVPVFWYRHYFCDKGKFPTDMLKDLLPPGETELGPTRCGIMPFVALAGGAAAMALGYIIFWTKLF
jgi:amino acid transporter